MNTGNARGQILVIILMVLLVALIFIPSSVILVREEVRGGVRGKQQTTAFQLAEAAVDRALWKLRETTSYWTQISSGIPLTGYGNDIVYSDVGGGSYRINVTPSSTPNELIVVATGKEARGTEFRAIEVRVLRQGVLSAPIHTPLLATSGSAAIHWGPLMSLSSIHMTGSSNQLYPRKYARGAITASGNYADRDASPGSPNTDGREWWSFNEPPGVPDPVAIDLAYYRTEATSQGFYYPTPPTSRTLSNELDTTSRARYYEGNVHFSGSKFFRGILIVIGDLTISGSGQSPQGDLTVPPPANAWEQYQKNTPQQGDSHGSHSNSHGGAGTQDDGNYGNYDRADGDCIALHQYPGDAGYHAVEAYNLKNGCVAHLEKGGGSGNPASFQGFIYVGGTLNASGSVVVHGAIQVASGGAMGSGSVEIYYDPSLTVRTTRPSFQQTSWRSATPVPF